MTSEPDRDEPRGLRAYYRAIADLGSIALKGLPRQELHARATRIVREAIGGDFAKILELQPTGHLLVTSGVGWPEGVVGELEIPAEGDSQASYALRLRQPVVVEDLRSEQRFDPHPVFLEVGVRSGVNVIMEGAQRPHGILEVDARTVRSYTEDEIAFLQLAANVLGGAIDRELRDQEREQFLETVSHEIRNPLTSAIGFARRLARSLPAGATVDPGAREELEILEEQVNRLGRAANLVFQLAQVERVLPRSPVLVAPLLHDLVDEIRGAYPDIEFEEEYLEPDVVVLGEEDAARAALRNILENAAKYSRQEPYRVHVSLKKTPNSVDIRVRDSCGGLSGDELRRMFEQNYRGQGRQASGGLGVGLYLALRVCSALGWQLDVENHPGRQCEFAIGIPSDSLPSTALPR